MRTREKFYENLNNKHVSIEKRQERFEFRDVKTLEKMVSDSDKLLSQHKSAADKYQKTEDEFRGHQMFVETINENYDKAKVFLVKEQEKQEKYIQRLQNDMRKKFDALNKATDKEADALKKMNDAEDKVMNLQNRIKGAADALDSNIKSFESAAKTLGVDVSSKSGKYKSMVSKLRDKEDLI